MTAVAGAVSSTSIQRSAAGLRSQGPAGPPPSRWLSWFTVAVFIHTTGALYALNFFSLSQLDLISELLWLAAYGVAAIGLFDAVIRRRRPVRPPIVLLAFVGLALASTAWSVQPPLTFTRAVALAGTVLVAVFIAHELPPIEFLDALRRAALLIAVASLLLYYSGSPQARDLVFDTLRGVLAQKNVLGRIMALGLLAALSSACLESRRWRRCLLSAVPMVWALALTDSASAVVVTTLGTVGLAIMQLWRLDKSRRLLPIFGVVVLGLFTLLLSGRVTLGLAASALGRDATLTGRTEIWSYALVAVRQRLLGGYGYGAYWESGGNGIPTGPFYYIGEAHNGLIEIALGIGVIGVVLAIAVIIGVFRAGIRDVRAGREHHAVMRFLIVGTACVLSIDESILFEQTGPWTFALAVASVTLIAVPAQPSTVPDAGIRRHGGQGGRLRSEVDSRTTLAHSAPLTRSGSSAGYRVQERSTPLQVASSMRRTGRLRPRGATGRRRPRSLVLATVAVIAAVAAWLVLNGRDDREGAPSDLGNYSLPMAPSALAVTSNVEFEPDGIHTSQHVVFDRPQATLTLVVPDLTAATSAGAQPQPKIDGLTIREGLQLPISVPRVPPAGQGLTVRLSRAASELDIEYVIHDAAIETDPSAQTASTWVATMGVRPLGAVSETVNVQGDGVTGVGCVQTDGAVTPCAQRTDLGWRVSFVPGEPAHLLAVQLDD